MDKNIYKINENTFDYYGYQVCRTGDILRKDRVTGEWCELKSYHFTYPGSHVTMWIGDKQKKVMKAKLIYELFSGETLYRSVVLQFRDGDKTNCAFENLYTISRKEFASREADYNKKKLDDTELKELKKLRKKRKVSLRSLSQIYGCSLKVIQKALHDIR